MENNRYKMTKTMRWEVAAELADKRLEMINKHVSEVTVKNTFYTKIGKRVIDLFISGIVLILIFPLNIAIAIITFFDVGRPLFFKQERMGLDKKVFYIIKFRNMRNSVDEKGELLPPHQRVTKFGKFVRKTSLDELLNFISIFKGDMSLIGPRPLPVEYYQRYNKKHLKRLAVRPGLECPPRYSINHVRTWQEQFENDIWYVENISLKTDIIMCIRLVQFALNRKNTGARSEATRGTFMGYDSDGKAINLDEVPQEYIDRAFERTYLHRISNVNLETNTDCWTNLETLNVGVVMR